MSKTHTDASREEKYEATLFSNAHQIFVDSQKKPDDKCREIMELLEPYTKAMGANFSKRSRNHANSRYLDSETCKSEALFAGFRAIKNAIKNGLIFDDVNRFGAYYNKALRTKLIDMIRQKIMSRTNDLSMDALSAKCETNSSPDGLFADQATVDPSDIVIGRETASIVEGVLAGSKHRAILDATIENPGMLHQDIANATGMPVGTISMRASRLRTKIREALDRSNNQHNLSL